MEDSAANSEVSAEIRTATIQMAVAGRKFSLEVSASTGPTRVADLLPLVNSLVDSFATITAETIEEKGGRISCKMGCAACCRQLIPLTEPEARRISELLDSMPEPGRSEMIARFDAARKKVADAGLLPELLAIEGTGTSEYVALALKYFRLWVTCPFLENEMCSIYQDRPIACREYVVITPAENCRELSPEKVKSVSLKTDFARAIAEVGADPASPCQTRIPLIFARRWTAANPDEPPMRPGTELLREFFQNLTEKEIPEAEASTGGA